MRRLPCLLLLAVGCSSDPTTPLVEYPPDSNIADAGFDGLPEAAQDSSSHADAGAETSTDAPPDTLEASDDAGPWTPPAREQVLSGSVFIESVTTDGHLIVDVDGDLMALRAGSTQPDLILQDYYVAEDSLLVRGRFAALWKGPDLTPPLTLWSAAGGVETFGTETRMGWFVARPAQDDFGYFTEGSDLLHVDLYATGVQKGAGARIVADLDTGLIEDDCRVQVAYGNAEMVVGGCPDGSTQPRLGAYDLAGGGLIRTILDDTIPGFWLNNARTHVLAQTTAAATLSPVAAGGGEVTFGETLVQARFSADDAAMVYLTDAGVLNRTPTSAADPTAVGQAHRILGRSANLDYVVVANVIDANDRSDLVLVDTKMATSRELAADNAV
jgi:hypothetical protein